MKPTREQKKIFKLAAERIANGTNLYCCCAIEEAGMTLDLPYTTAKKLFKEAYEPYLGATLYWRINDPAPHYDTQTARIIALLSLTHL